jgi:glucose/arabinose dehydrogenase
MYADAGFSKGEKKIDCNNVRPAYVGFSAHSSPLGFEYFDSSNSSPALKDSFLVALHGSSKRSLRRGYRKSSSVHFHDPRENSYQITLESTVTTRKNMPV